MDEQLLIDGCKRGEASARKELYELYAPAMMSVCARYVHDRETARDLLQDGFIKVLDHTEILRGKNRILVAVKK